MAPTRPVRERKAPVRLIEQDGPEEKPQPKPVKPPKVVVLTEKERIFNMRVARVNYVRPDYTCEEQRRLRLSYLHLRCKCKTPLPLSFWEWVDEMNVRTLEEGFEWLNIHYADKVKERERMEEEARKEAAKVKKGRKSKKSKK